jgi:4-amino-4-deoxy-L-arabinose transferase-like glycosyltransferase
MSTSTEVKGQAEWPEVVLSFLSPAQRTRGAKERLLAYRLPLILLIQAGLTFRLNDIVNDDEALYIRGGTVVIAHLLHGGAANAGLLRFYGSFFSGAPNLYPVVAAVLDGTGGLLVVRFFSLLVMLVATVSVHKIAKHLFSEKIALLASMVFALTGSVQFIGHMATFDAPCMALLAVAAAFGITKRSIFSAVIAGVLLALTSATKYAGVALVPFVLLLTFVACPAGGGSWRENFPKAALRGGIATLAFAGSLLIGYHLWGSGISVGLKFTTTARHALDPGPTWYLLESLAFDIGIAFLLTIGSILLMMRRRAWNKAGLLAINLMAGSIIQIGSVRINEFTSLDKHTAFSALFFAIPAAVLLDWAFSQRNRVAVAALVVVWLILIDGMWRSDYQYSWPSSIMAPIGEIETANIPGQYFSFDSDTGSYYTRNQMIDWYPSADAYSIFYQGAEKVEEAEKGHRFAGFLFEPTDLSAQNRGELRVLERLLASDPYYVEIGTFRVSPYTKVSWQLWVHYPPGYHGPSLKQFSSAR